MNSAYEGSSDISGDRGAHVEQCDDGREASPGKFCLFDIKKIPNNCTKDNNYGYERGVPCVLIKLNRVS